MSSAGGCTGDYVVGKLEPFRAKIARVCRRSSAPEMFRAGTSALVIGGRGSRRMGGWGNLMTALASSGTSTSIASAAKYLTSLKKRRGNKAVVELAIAFR